jgi:addiction module HigA family antidote
MHFAFTQFIRFFIVLGSGYQCCCEGGDMAELANVHPGDVLREEFIAPMGLTRRNIADAIGLLQDDLTSLMDGRCEVDVDIARKLSRFFGTSVQFWLGLQADYEVETGRCET